MPSDLAFDLANAYGERPTPLASRLASSTALRLALLGVAAYAATLVATLPARTVLQWAGAGPVARDASGTVWNGRVVLDQGFAATWKLAPFRSLGQLAVAADLVVDGPGTALTGRSRWRPGMLALDGVTGRAGWPLAAALKPDLPVNCDFSIGVDIRRLVVAGARSGAEGQLTSAAGSCSSRTGVKTGVPALVATATMDAVDSRVWIAPLTSPASHLADASLTRQGALKAEVHPAGAALLPAGALPGSLSLETRL